MPTGLTEGGELRRQMRPVASSENKTAYLRSYKTQKHALTIE